MGTRNWNFNICSPPPRGEVEMRKHFGWGAEPRHNYRARFDTPGAMESPLSRSATACLKPTSCARWRNQMPSGECRATPSKKVAIICVLLRPKMHSRDYSLATRLWLCNPLSVCSSFPLFSRSQTNIGMLYLSAYRLI